MRRPPRPPPVHRAIADFRSLHDDGAIATVVQTIGPPSDPQLHVVLSDGSIRRCPATDKGFAALLAELRASQDAEDRA